MDAEQRRIFRECTQRSDRPTEQANEAWLICGRRSGKSFILALVAVFLACFKDWTPYLGIGERGTITVIAADRRQARTIMRYVKGLLELVPMLRQLVEAKRAESIDLTNRITIEVHTCSFRTVRGYTVLAALCDEMAFWLGEDSSNPDAEVINAIRPAMATVPGSMLLCASSPYSRRGALWESYCRSFGKEGGPLVWQAPTRTMNPTVPQSFIDAEMEKDPSSASAEYFAQFRTDIESFISREAIEAVIDWGVYERGPVSGNCYAAFCDPSGGSADSFSLAIAHKEGETGILDCIREVRPPFSPDSVVHEFADLLRLYRVTKIVGDKFAGEWVKEPFRKFGINYDASAKPKSDLYRDALPLINSGKVRLLDDHRLINQLTSLERRTARGGRDSIDHPHRAHDDRANAVIGALLTATTKRPQARVGAIGVDGRITWHDAEPERPRIRIVTITEKEDLRRRGLL